MTGDNFQIDGKVYPFAFAVKSHPGDFMKHLQNRDLLPWMRLSHGTRYDDLWAALPSIGDGPFVYSSADQMWLQIWDDVHVMPQITEVVANSERRAMVMKAMWTIAMILFFSSALAPISFVFKCLAWTVLSCVHLAFGWWAHDRGHDDARGNDAIRSEQDLWGTLVLGSPLGQFHRSIHRIHHLFPQAVDRDARPIDTALDTAPVRWFAQNEFAIKWRLHGLFQVGIWMGVVVPSTYALILIHGMQNLKFVQSNSVKATYRVRLLALAALSLFAPKIALAYILSIAAPAAWMTLVSSLNHFPLSVQTGVAEGVLNHVSVTTQNIRTRDNVLNRFLFGGLDCHIEHHLFPQLPSNTLRVVQPLVKDIFSRSGLHYQEVSFVRAVIDLCRTLFRAPLRSANPEVFAVVSDEKRELAHG